MPFDSPIFADPTDIPDSSPVPVAPAFRSAIFGDPTQTYLAESARTGRDWSEVSKEAGPRAGVTEGQYKLQARRAYESQRSETAQEFVATRSLPFASAIGNTAREVRYKRVMDQVAAGQSPSDDDIEFVARHEHLAQFKAERQKTLGGALAEVGAGIPALLGEAMTARAGSTAALGAERVGKLGTAGRAGLSAAEAPLMPSLYAEQAAQRATQQGGDATDFKNLAPPLAMAALSNVVLGRLQGAAAKSTVPTQAGKLAYAGGLGVIEQGAADVGASAVDEVLDPAYKTNTRYGALGDLARGDPEKAATHATVQALTFAAFAALHGREANPAETIAPALDSLAKKGMSKEKAAAVVNDAVAGKIEPPTEAVKQHVETVEEATRWPGDLPGRAARDKALADAAEQAKAGKPAVYVDMDIDNLKGLDKAVGSDSARNHVKDFVEIVKSELAGTGAEVKVFRHSGDPQGDEHSAVVVGADKRAVDAALRSAQAKIAEFTQAKGIADIPHSKGGRPNGVGVTAFAEPIKPDRPWKTTVTEAEMGMEDAKARKVAEPVGKEPTGQTEATNQASVASGRSVGKSPTDPLAGIPDADVKALAKQLGLTAKGLRDRADEPGVKAGIDRLRGKPAPEATKPPEPVAEPQVDLAQQPEAVQPPQENAPQAPGRAPEPGVASGPSEVPIVRQAQPQREGRALSDREAHVLDETRNGVSGPELGEKLGVSRQRIDQILDAALAKSGEGLDKKAFRERIAEDRRNRALDLIEQRQQRNPETNQPVAGVDLGELRNLPPKEADRALAVREGERSRDIANEDYWDKKAEPLLKRLKKIEEDGNAGRKVDGAERDRLLGEVQEFQRNAENRTRPPRKQPKGRKAAGAGAEPVAEGGVAPRPGGRPAVPARGDEGGVPQAVAPGGAGPRPDAQPPNVPLKPIPTGPRNAGAAPAKLTPSNTLAREVMRSGGIDPESHSFKTIFESVKDARENGLGTPGLFKKGGRGLDQLAQELHAARVIPDAEPATLIRLLQGKADVPWHDASRKIEAALAAHEKAQQEEADARQKALRSGHSATSDEEAVRRGQEDGEAEARAEAEASRTDEPAGADASFDPAEFGRPLTDAERRTDLGGGQENAGGVPARGLHETALANARVDAERAKNGLPPLMAAARRANPDVWDQAMAKLAADPNVSARLVEELAADSRATTVDENALLLHRKIALNNEYERTMRQAADAMLAKNLPEFDRLDARATELLGQIDKTDKVTRSTGTEWGRAGQFRRQLAKEDFSLSRMMLEAERAKREPLTAEEKATVQKQHEEIAKHAERLEKAESGKEPAAKPGAKGDLTDLRVAEQKAKQAAKETVTRLAAGAKPLYARVGRAALESGNAVRAIITSLDLSAVGRQGGILSSQHPILAGKAFVDSLKSGYDSHHFARAEDILRHRENAGLYKQSGLYLADHLTAPEEAYIGRWVKKIPGVAASERAYTGYLNRLRADVFDARVATFPRDGRATPVELKAIANDINVATGRGRLPGSLEKSADMLAHAFFSPRYLWSRLQILAGQPFYGGTYRTRALLAKEYAKSLAGLGVFYATMMALNKDAELTFDPRSSDFGKVKLGRFRVDPLTGFSQLVTLGARLVSGETKSTETGRVSALGGPKHQFGETDTGDVVLRFLRNKAAPVPGTVYDVLARERGGGRPTTWEHLAGSVVPISIKDVWESLTSDQGVPRGPALALLAILGMGTQNYEPRVPKKSTESPLLPVFPSGEVQPRRRPAGVR